MDFTIHFFIPLGELIPVPDRFCSTRKPSGFEGVNADSLSPTRDGIHFIFHHVEFNAPLHLGLEASLAAISVRVGDTPNLGHLLEGMSRHYQTVVEVMVELGGQTLAGQKHDSTEENPSLDTLAFDYAVDELNLLLRAISFVQKFPIKEVSRESVAPMIPFAFSTRKPWEMLEDEELPELELGGLFNLNSNFPLSPDILGNFDDFNKWINASLVNLSSRGPFTTYLDFRREADINRSKEGNYRAATIMYAAACESLFEDLLQHNLWEQQIRPEKAKEKFVTRKGYPQSISYLVNDELGCFYSSEGWRKETPVPIASWSKHVAQLRNKAVHEGYTPNTAEMKRCLEAVNQLVTFLADQVFETRRKRPITALALLGRQGLEKRDGWNESFFPIASSLEDVNFRLKTFRRWADALSSMRSRDQPEKPVAKNATCFLVLAPTGQQTLFLVEAGGARTRRITRAEVTFPPAVEQKIDGLQHAHPPTNPQAVTLPFDSVTLADESAWDLYSYDEIPGYEVFLPSDG